MLHTGCVDKAVMVLSREQGIRQIAEEQLKQASHTVNIMIKVLWVPEVQGLVLGIYKCVSTLV